MSDSAPWRDALLFQAETARTSLPRSSRVTRWCETMKHNIGYKQNVVLVEFKLCFLTQ